MEAWREARRVVLKARYLAERVAARLHKTVSREPASIALVDVQRRLELVLTAAYGRPITIAPIQERDWQSLRRVPTPTVEGNTIKLPAHLATRGDARRAADRYRLLAIEQAERMIRGTTAHAPMFDPLERDLYLLREAATIDAGIARLFPGLLETLNDERAAALAARPNSRRLTESERGVETLLQNALAARPEEADAASGDPQASLVWARNTANDIRRLGAAYRGIALAPAWGLASRVDELGPDADDRIDQTPLPRRSAPDTRGSQSDEPAGDSGDDSASDNDEQDDDRGREREDGSTTPDTSDTTGSGASAALSLDTARDSTEGLPPPIYYAEWNSDRGSYTRPGAAVRIYEATSGDPTVLNDDLQRHAATSRQIRHQFERLRARRTILPRQQRGDSLDISACVDAMIARRMGDSPDDHLYVETRPARRGLAIALLIDVSGSTDQRVTEALRIIDLEKISLVLATRALDALGDSYAIYAFAGSGASNVKITVVKDFAESNADRITRRVAALSASGFTRMGAAIRHATRELVHRSAGHRLLLLLSDGRPHDVDMYQGPYGVEDARQAIHEARASGVFPFCLTIDKAASEYLPRIFGDAGHTVLQKPEQLPKALLTVVRSLVKQ